MVESLGWWPVLFRGTLEGVRVHGCMHQVRCALKLLVIQMCEDGTWRIHEHQAPARNGPLLLLALAAHASRHARQHDETPVIKPEGAHLSYSPHQCSSNGGLPCHSPRPRSSKDAGDGRARMCGRACPRERMAECELQRYACNLRSACMHTVHFDLGMRAGCNHGRFRLAHAMQCMHFMFQDPAPARFRHRCQARMPPRPLVLASCWGLTSAGPVRRLMHMVQRWSRFRTFGRNARPSLHPCTFCGLRAAYTRTLAPDLATMI